MSRTLAILGGGQLARMIAEAAGPLGIRCRALDPSPEACARHACELVVGAYDDPGSLVRLTDGAEALTFEFENVPPRSLEIAAGLGVRIAPGVRSLRESSDRLLEKRLFGSLGIPVPAYAAVGSIHDLREAIGELGAPLVLKTRSGGYDGKGQADVASSADAEAAWDSIGRRPAIAESRVRFRRELSAIVCRSSSGQAVAYPLSENTHDRGILARSVSPADTSPATAALATGWAATLANELGHVGVLALELFDTGEGLLANELAPRVHNTGHGSIEGCAASQFENHARAVMGLPLVEPEPIGFSVMLNLTGSIRDEVRGIDRNGVTVHDYGKSPAPRRKLGHVTVTGPTREHALATAAELAPLCAIV
jgi:5-(carboxyamino)imidazole ribonucleotide synthase